MSTHYDAIVVGARCAGSPVAMLLARMGQRVLLVDRDTFPSDTISTHLLHAPGVAALARWGLLDRLVDTGCPPITNYSYDFGPFTVSGSPRPTCDGVGVAYGPRRTVLDKILLDAASEAGAEVRTNCSVQDLIIEDGRVVGIRAHDSAGAAETFEERSDLVIGADGRNSVVARAVGAQQSGVRPALAVSYYAY
ncbi:MAG: FAD-dependent monooxygenase, partial [Actinomycetia bacterium]|nr:FAD-dependent monooxygenase [Actinomycetes bacterium]